MAAQHRDGDGSPLEDLAAILQMAPTSEGGVYTWPGWIARPLAELDDEQKAGAVRLMQASSFEDIGDITEYYTGPRTAVRDDGVWLYYLGGD